MELAFGMLDWTPETFWNATYREFHAAIRGRAEMLQAKSGGGGSHRKMTGREKADLLAWTKDMQAKYPDGPSIKAKG